MKKSALLIVTFLLASSSSFAIGTSSPKYPIHGHEISDQELENAKQNAISSLEVFKNKARCWTKGNSQLSLNDIQDTVKKAHRANVTVQEELGYDYDPDSHGPEIEQAYVLDFTLSLKSEKYIVRMISYEDDPSLFKTRLNIVTIYTGKDIPKNYEQEATTIADKELLLCSY